MNVNVSATVRVIDEQKKAKLATFGRFAAECLPKFVQRVQVHTSFCFFISFVVSLQFAAGDELELLVHPSGIVPVMSFLKGHHSAQFTNFTFACGVDVPTRENRFEVSLSILSLHVHSFIHPFSLLADGLFSVLCSFQRAHPSSHVHRRNRPPRVCHQRV